MLGCSALAMCAVVPLAIFCGKDVFVSRPAPVGRPSRTARQATTWTAADAAARLPSLMAPCARSSDGPGCAGELSSLDYLKMKLDLGTHIFAISSQAELEALMRMVKETGRVLVVDYYAPWCRACKNLMRSIHQLADKDSYRDVTFATVDFQKNRDLCEARGVTKLPTLEIFRGEALTRWSPAAQQLPQERWFGASRSRLVKKLDGVLDAV